MILSYLSGVNDLASLKTTVEKALVQLFQTTRPNKQGTFPETSIVPENRPSQKETSIPTIHLQVRAVGSRRVTCCFAEPHDPTSIEDMFFSLATPCPKCPTLDWVFYLKRYWYHSSHSFHDSCCECSACLTWAHVGHAKFKLQKSNFWSEAHSSGRDAGPLQDGVLCMYEASWASQVLTRRASHATSHNKACCQVFCLRSHTCKRLEKGSRRSVKVTLSGVWSSCNVQK